FAIRHWTSMSYTPGGRSLNRTFPASALWEPGNSKVDESTHVHIILANGWPLYRLPLATSTRTGRSSTDVFPLNRVMPTEQAMCTSNAVHFSDLRTRSFTSPPVARVIMVNVLDAVLLVMPP